MKWNARNIVACIIANLLILAGCVRRAKRKAMSGDFILSFYFHNPSKREFEGCINWLKKNGFKFLSLEDLNNIKQNNLPFPRGGVLMTLDDGWETNERNVVALAEEYLVPITIFVSSEPVENGVYWWSYLEAAKRNNFTLPHKSTLKKISNGGRVQLINQIKERMKLPREAMTIDQVKLAAKSEFVTIGGHTHTHPILPNCNEIEVLSELSSSKLRLEEWTGKKISFFAYPNGDYGQREKSVLEELNYEMAFTCEPRCITKDSLHNHFALPRFGLVEGASLAENICRMVGVWKPLMLKFRYPKRRTSTNNSFSRIIFNHSLGKRTQDKDSAKELYTQKAT